MGLKEKLFFFYFLFLAVISMQDDAQQTVITADLFTSSVHSAS